MSAKYSFTLEGPARRWSLPRKLIIGQEDAETIAPVLLKLLGFLLFHRERLQMGINLHNDTIPFVPDLVQLDYELRVKFWVECGECAAAKLDRLAVKVPEAEIWVMRRSLAEAEQLLRAMAKAELRRDRYGIVALDEPMFEELCGLVQSRNRVTWVSGAFEPPNLQFDFNGLWFDAPFTVLRF